MLIFKLKHHSFTLKHKTFKYSKPILAALILLPLLAFAIIQPKPALGVSDADAVFHSNPAATIPACNGWSECFAFSVDTRLDEYGNTNGTNTTFAIPTSGAVFALHFSHPYNWIIDWGDGTTEVESGTSSETSSGISHTYTTPGEYRITIRPAGVADSASASNGWFNAFGFQRNETGANANANKYLFRSINAPFTDKMRKHSDVTDQSYRFALIFQSAINGLGIPAGLFDQIDTSGSISFNFMFQATFAGYAQNSTTATIPVGLFDFFDTSGANGFYATFDQTFYGYAENSTAATIPVGLFDSIDIDNGTANMFSMFAIPFLGYATRTASFSVDGTVVDLLTQSFTNPYNTKVGTAGTPADSPVLTPGDVVKPTYNDTVRSITKPTGIYAEYDWYRTDGTSCAVVNPTKDCGVQDSSALVSFPNDTEWTPTTSTDKGSIVFYNYMPIPPTNPEDLTTPFVPGVPNTGIRK